MQKMNHSDHLSASGGFFIILGKALIVTGVWMKFGTAWGLIALGVAVIIYGVCRTMAADADRKAALFDREAMDRLKAAIEEN